MIDWDKPDLTRTVTKIVPLRVGTLNVLMGKLLLKAAIFNSSYAFVEQQVEPVKAIFKLL